jgi:hypothetical protein
MITLGIFALLILAILVGCLVWFNISRGKKLFVDETEESKAITDHKGYDTPGSGF